MKKQIDVIIADDDVICRRTLRNYLQQNHPELRVLAEASTGMEAYNAIKMKSPDVVFLDINMPDLSGFELLERFTDPSFLTVFYSASTHKAIEAIKHNALYFLEKPLSIHDLRMCVKKVVDACGKKFSDNYPELQRKVEFYSNGRTYYVRLCDITHIEGSGSYSVIYRENSQRLLVSRNLKSLLEELDSPYFHRTHNSFAINVTKVTECSFKLKSCIVGSGVQVQLAVRRIDEFRSRMEELWSKDHSSAPASHSPQHEGDARPLM
jgi:two-component system LytT family response regulator